MTDELPWQPDFGMVAAVIAAPVARTPITRLSSADRCWLVAALTLSGWSVAEIQNKIGGSERLTKSVRAEPGFDVAFWAQQKIAAMESELAAWSGRWRDERRVSAQLRVEIDRLRAQRAELIDAVRKNNPVDFCKRGHPLVGWNVYKNNGRRFCQECRRVRRQQKSTNVIQETKMLRKK